MRFRVPEIFLGAFLAIAIFAMGMLFTLSQRPPNATERRAVTETADQGEQVKPLDSDLTGSTWLTKDAAGFFTFVLVCVGGVQAWFFLAQLRLIRQNLADTKNAAHAAERAATATENAVELARGTAERQLRAYVVASAGEVQRIEGGFILSAALTNSGQTPAFNTRLMGESFGEAYPLATEHVHQLPGEDFGVTLGAGDDFQCAYRIFTHDPDDTWRRAQAGEVGLWIQGVVMYNDCFGKSHMTKFRFVYGGRLAAATIHMHADRQGNEAD